MGETAYDTMVDALLVTLPQLKERYENWFRQWGETFNAHVVYGDILNPYVANLLNMEGKDTELRQIFEFLEELAKNKDPLVREVVKVTVCEYLGDNKDRLSQARRYMGENTLQLSLESEREVG